MKCEQTNIQTQPEKIPYNSNPNAEKIESGRENLRNQNVQKFQGF